MRFGLTESRAARACSPLSSATTSQPIPLRACVMDRREVGESSTTMMTGRSVTRSSSVAISSASRAPERRSPSRVKHSASRSSGRLSTYCGVRSMTVVSAHDSPGLSALDRRTSGRVLQALAPVEYRSGTERRILRALRRSPRETPWPTCRLLPTRDRRRIRSLCTVVARAADDATSHASSRTSGRRTADQSTGG